ncbi:B-cell receptor CD22-like [Colossoma macropomum]|uniref:B-cell receptor CD22-like n=1 Tax=Colossoma macropomum TaxID=42526 RepID=UPI0018647FA9|nr:B-cell receptor CD22-like [Colossoma macropomum]
MGSRLCNQLFHASYVSGAFGTEWSVKYNQQEICALKGSTVFMNGTYTHPERLKLKETFWVIDPVKNVEPTDLSKNPDYSARVEHLTDKQTHFALKLNNVTENDKHEYCFRLIVNVEKANWLGYPGVKLTVTELHVETPEEVTEGETADLTCKTTCSLTDPTFIWYKNGRPLTTKTIKNNQLHLQTVSSEDAGSYSCAVRGYQHLHSTAHNLRVRYHPKNVSVSISSSGNILVGFSVNLSCSSDGYPPVKNYTWFKEGGTSPVGSGQNYIPLQSGSYYCEAQNQHGAQTSALMPVDLNAGHSVILYAAAGVGLCGVAVFLTIFFWMRRKRQTRNMNEPDYVNTRLRAKPPDEDSCNVDDYENVTKADLKAPPPDDDSSSVDVYENMTKSGPRAPPPDDDPSSDIDYENVTFVRAEKQHPPPVNSQTADRDSRTSDDVKPQGPLK